MTVGSFVCTSCSGLLRGLNPPHRVKSISMASFTQEEIDLIKSRGNQYCSAVWLGLYDPKLTPFPDTKDEHKIRDFMITKYEKKRFYIDPSVALKIMPPNQDTSASSSAASTPGSDTASRGVAGATMQTTTTTTSSVSRPSVPASQSLGSVSSSGSSLSSMTSPPPPSNNNNNTKLPGPRPSASLDLLSDLGQSTRSTLPPGDPFASPTAKQTPSSGPQAAPVSQASFANFENANIFVNNASGPTASTGRPAPSGPHLPFSSNPLTPLTPNTSTTSSSTPNTTNASPAPGNPSLDRYAALKDLDEEFKTQKENETTNGGVSWAVSNGGGPHHPPTSTASVPNNTSASVFGGSTMNGAVFGSPPTGVFGGGVNGGGPVMGTPPTAPSTWQNFSGPNPFSGVNSGGAWVNGGAQMTNPGPTHTQQGFGTMVQPNPFGAIYGMWAPDPNFNQFGGGAALNGAGAGAGAGGGWASFPHPQQPSKMAWTATNGTPNPFMAAAPQMPSSGSSYNPFL